MFEFLGGKNIDLFDFPTDLLKTTLIGLTKYFCNKLASPMIQDFQQTTMHGVGGSSRGPLYDSHHSPQPEHTHSRLARAGPPTITAAAAALGLLVTDRRRHVPLAHPRTRPSPKATVAYVVCPGEG